MNPIEVLIQEHRLIERVVALLRKRSYEGSNLRETDIAFLTPVVDFFQVYADLTHHGKEEGILFREFAKKQLSAEHAKLMKALITEHIFARVVTHRLREAQVKHLGGNQESVAEIVQSVKDLVTLHPFHIEKEEKRFFHLSFEYLSSQEQRAILEEFLEFDRTPVQERYQRIVEALEKSSH